MRKIYALILLVIFVILLVSIGGIYFYNQQQREKFISEVSEPIKNTSIRISMDLEAEIDPSDITFEEEFKKLNSDIAEIDNNLIKIESVTNDKYAKQQSIFVEYMKSGQNLLRTELAKNRNMLAIKSATEYMDNIESEDYDPTNQFEVKYRIKNLTDAVNSAKSKLTDYNSSVEDYKKALRDFSEKRKNVRKYIADDFLVKNEILEKLLRKYDKSAK